MRAWRVAFARGFLRARLRAVGVLPLSLLVLFLCTPSPVARRGLAFVGSASVVPPSSYASGLPLRPPCKAAGFLYETGPRGRTPCPWPLPPASGLVHPVYLARFFRQAERKK